MKKPDKAVVLNGKPFQFNAPPPSLVRVAEFLDKQPDEAFFTAAYLAAQCKISPTHLKDSVNHSALVGYSFKWGGKRYYGNKKSVAQKFAESVQ